MHKAVIHLVEDDATVRSMVKRLLISGGYGVREYSSGKELLACTDALAPGFILLDIDMPESDGFAVHRSLVERSIDLPVIMMTGGGDLTALAFKVGVTDFIQKPFGRSELLSLLDQVRSQRCSALTH